MAEQVKVSHGINDGTFDVAGRTVRWVRNALASALNIPADAIPFVNGQQVTDDYIVPGSSTLDFQRAGGTKGYSSGTTPKIQVVKFVSWQEDGGWLGYLQDYPDYWTQGDTLDDLKEHLKDLHADLTSGELPGIRKVDDLVIS